MAAVTPQNCTACFTNLLFNSFPVALMRRTRPERVPWLCCPRTMRVPRGRSFGALRHVNDRSKRTVSPKLHFRHVAINEEEALVAVKLSVKISAVRSRKTSHGLVQISATWLCGSRISSGVVGYRFGTVYTAQWYMCAATGGGSRRGSSSSRHFRWHACAVIVIGKVLLCLTILRVFFMFIFFVWC